MRHVSSKHSRSTRVPYWRYTSCSLPARYGFARTKSLRRECKRASSFRKTFELLRFTHARKSSLIRTQSATLPSGGGFLVMAGRPGGDSSGSKIPVVVFNPLSWDRTDVVKCTAAPPPPYSNFSLFTLRDETGKETPFECSGCEAPGVATLIFVAEGVPP